MTEKLYLAIDPKGPAYKRLMDWRKELLDAERVWRDYTKALGADTYFCFPYCAPTSFQFVSGKPPANWTKPDSRYASRPKKTNKAAWAELEALPQPDTLDGVAASLGLPEKLLSENGWRRLGGFWVWSLAWVGDQLWIVGEDFRASLVEYRQHHPDGKLDRGDGEIPPGFIVSSKARYDLAAAQAAIEREDAETSA
ncbi:hypothetical protein LCM08_06325 [Salipiger pacificus]|nr:hypothetical protein [Alloyangia pacifica]